MEDTLENMLDLAAQLPEGLSAATDELGELLTKIKDAEKEGVEFSKQEVPSPAVLVES
jgi:hypothetical protein